MTAPLTPEQLAEVRARERLAIGGTWEARVAEDREGILYPTVKIDGEQVVIPIPDTAGDHTAIFIAHARTDVPDLLAALDAATERAEKAEAALARVEALAEKWRYKGEFGWGTWQEGYGPDAEGHVLDCVASELREAMEGTP